MTREIIEKEIVAMIIKKSADHTILFQPIYLDEDETEFQYDFFIKVCCDLRVSITYGK